MSRSSRTEMRSTYGRGSRCLQRLAAAAAASAVAGASFSGTVAAQSVALDPQLRAELLSGLWLTGTARVMQAKAATDGLEFSDQTAASGYNERWHVKATGGSTLQGAYYTSRLGLPDEVGSISLEAESERLIGRYRDGRGDLREYVACRVPRLAGQRRWAAGVWNRVATASRDPSDPETVVVAVEQIWSGGGTVTLNASPYKAVLRSADGRRTLSDAANYAEAAPGDDYAPTMEPCDIRTLILRFKAAGFASRSVEITRAGEPFVALPVSVAAIAGEPAPAPAPAPDPAPEPAPIPAPEPSPPGPAPQPAPAPAPSPGQDQGGLQVPAGASEFQTYGPWEFRVDELVRGPDGQLQAVLSVRNGSQQRLPFGAADLEVSVIDADGVSVQRLGNLYRVAPSGSAAALVNAGTSYLEPGDQIRVRLLFDRTKSFDPVRLRLKEPVRSQTLNTYPLR